MKTAFGVATQDEKLQRTAFLNYVSLEIATGKCRAITAPGMREVHSGITQAGGNQGQKRPLEDDHGGGLSKGELNKIRQQAKKQALNEARRQLAINPPPPPHSAPRPAGQSKAALKRARAAALRDASGGGAGGGGAGPGLRALQNGGVSDGQGKAAGKGGKGGKGGACYAWNDGNPCKQTPCPFTHVCSKCGGQHKRSACPQGGA